MGADPKTAFGPAGIGDLYVTATSPRSRNRTLGEKLGSGLSLDQALDVMHMVAEGVRATRMFLERSVKIGHQTPFLLSLGGLLDGDIDVEESVRLMVDAYDGL